VSARAPASTGHRTPGLVLAGAYSTLGPGRAGSQSAQRVRPSPHPPRIRDPLAPPRPRTRPSPARSPPCPARTAHRRTASRRTSRRPAVDSFIPSLTHLLERVTSAALARAAGATLRHGPPRRRTIGRWTRDRVHGAGKENVTVSARSAHHRQIFACF
jgi:hypothetical protein